MGILYDLYRQIKGRRCGMEKILLSLGVYFEVKDAELYGGEGTIGYTSMIMDISVDGLQKADFAKFVNSQIEGTANFCKVPLENVRVITREEYEENTDD